MSFSRAFSVHFPRTNAVLGNAFPLLAVAGLLLAGWGLIVTPDEIRAGGETSFWKLMKSAEPNWAGTSGSPSGSPGGGEAAHLR